MTSYHEARLSVHPVQKETRSPESSRFWELGVSEMLVARLQLHEPWRDGPGLARHLRGRQAVRWAQGPRLQALDVTRVWPAWPLSSVSLPQ